MTGLRTKIVVLLLGLLLAGTAFAVTLQEAKEQGLVGEQRDGYVGLVASNVPAEVQALVRQVNEQRRQRYEQIARDNGITMAQVTTLAYEQAVQATQSGHYIQLPNGDWVRK
jgi:uncharacterized protein YdbL (DUF1318 family)